MTAPKGILAHFFYASRLAQLVDAVVHQLGYGPTDRTRAFIFDRLASGSVIEPQKASKGTAWNYSVDTLSSCDLESRLRAVANGPIETAEHFARDLAATRLVVWIRRVAVSGSKALTRSVQLEVPSRQLHRG
jgi:hypothetical protein